jgi:tetratricopeptide (TPR) repeat protein
MCAIRETQIAELSRRIEYVRRLRPPPAAAEMSNAYAELADLLRRNHRYDAAIQAGFAAIELDPTNTPAYCYTIDSMARAGRAQEALERFSRLPRRMDRVDRGIVRDWLEEAKAYLVDR